MATKPEDIRFDFSSLYDEGGLSKSQWNQALPRARKARSRLAGEVRSGKIGFWKLPERCAAPDVLRPIERAAGRLKREFDNLVLIGIGGSALGARMLQNALAHRYHNELAKRPKNGLRIYLLENNDPDSFHALMNHLDISRTCFNVISKSGSTAETACQFISVRDRLMRRFPDDWKRRFLFTTDPSSGILRELADTGGIESLAVPQDVGGRYSVLSAVGLLPLLAMGGDAKALLAGASRMAARCLEAAPSKNPALFGALLHFLADRELGRNLLVAFPYSDRLRDWTEWFCQLWAESIGKERTVDGRLVNAGTTLIKTLGAIDQHSQVQLYMEGPNDKVFMFLRVENFDKDVKFPAKSRTPQALEYLSGHGMQELIQAEQTATRFALGKQKRLSYQVNLPRVDADSVGQLLFWAEAMTVLAGYLYEINPFDQPGVELGKKYAYGLMGRKGFDEYRDRIMKK